MFKTNPNPTVFEFDNKKPKAKEPKQNTYNSYRKLVQEGQSGVQVSVNKKKDKKKTENEKNLFKNMFDNQI